MKYFFILREKNKRDCKFGLIEKRMNSAKWASTAAFIGLIRVNLLAHLP